MIFLDLELAEDESLKKFQQDILLELRPEVKKNLE